MCNKCHTKTLLYLLRVTQEQKHHYDYILDIPIDIISGCSSEQEQVKMDDTLACQTDMLPKVESQVTLDSESEVTAAQSEEIDPAYCEPAHFRYFYLLCLFS